MAADLVTGGLEKIGEILVEITGRQLSYLIHYNKNIENLKEQVNKLEVRKQGVQQSKETAKKNVEEIVPEIDSWLENVDHIMAEAQKFLQDDANANKKCLYGWLPDLKSRYRRSREAAKKEQRVTQLKKEGKFNHISTTAPSKVIEIQSSEDFIAFKSTKLVMKDVVEALKDGKIKFIGLHGMGGVGKTTLAKEIAKKAKEDRLFDNVVMAKVSQTVELKRIQDQIAEMLGLTLNSLYSDTVRASLLHARLKDEKRILVILDDVWEILDVKAIGIPFGVEHEGCKVMFTSRREQVYKAMGTGDQTPKIIHLGTLSESESLALFRRSVGDDIDNYSIKDEANKVVGECRGLPMALVTVGRAMKGKDLNGWKEAVRDLKKSKLTNLEGVDQRLFGCLKLSYDYLRDEEAKSCFLLCSLFPEDHNIKIELLIRYGWGLRIFKNVDTIQDARDSAHSIFNNLKASCLLLKGNEEGSVKMHDVVRDVAISIGSEMYHVKVGLKLEEFPRVETLQHYYGISLIDNNIHYYHDDAWDCPNLQILLMQNSHGYLEQEMPEGVFQGMKTIKVLDRSGIPLTSLEPSFFHLSNLRTLILESHRLECDTVIGEIKTLEILSLARCELTNQLNEVRQLQNLRLLDLTECRYSSKANIIPAYGVISSLSSRLEELYLYSDKSFNWECERIDKETESSISDYPNINEPKSLRRLTVLTIQIQSIQCIPKDFVFPETIKTFIISIGCGFVLKYFFGNVLHINMIQQGGAGMYSSVMRLLKQVLRRTNYLFFEQWNDFSNALPDLLIDGDGLNVLKTLRFESCDMVEYLIDTTTKSWVTTTHQHIMPFYELEDVEQRWFIFQQKNEELRGLDEFKSLCHDVLPLDYTTTKSWVTTTHQMPFYELEDVELHGLDNFKSLCHGVLPPDLCLSKLKSVVIRSCPMLKSVLSLQLLQRLHLLHTVDIGSCAALENVFDLEGENDKRLLSSLARLLLYELSELKHIWIGPTALLNMDSLREMNIRFCNKLKFLFPPAIAQRLPKLEQLWVRACDELELIVADEQEVGNEAAKKMVFPNLRTLVLRWLPKLNAFSTGNYSFEWPSLEDVIIYGCPEMETFTCDESQTTPQLTYFKLEDQRLPKEELNVNVVVQKRFEEEEMKKTTTSSSYSKAAEARRRILPKFERGLNKLHRRD